MAVALYARVSTARQAEKDLSIPDQLRRMRDYCKTRSLAIGTEYIEAGASATDDRRPEFQQMIADASQDPAPYEAIIVHSRSRFFRDLFEYLRYERRLKRAGVRVISITQQTSDDPAGEMASKIFSLFDEYQSKENGKHTLRSMQENARQGFFNGSRPHFGFKTIEDEARGNKGQRKKRIAVNDDEAAIVRDIFGLYLNGHQGLPLGCKSTAYHLNERGITMRGRRWSRARIFDVLSDRAYIGEYFFNRMESKSRKVKPQSEWVRLAVDPIIDVATFERVRARRASRSPLVVAPRIVNSPTLLTGLLKCGYCGAGMTLATGKGGRYRYYKCNTRIGKGINYCKCGNVPTEKLDHLVLTSLADRVFTAARVKVMLENLARRMRDDRKDQQRELAGLNHELAEITRRIERLYESIEKGVIRIDDTLRDRTEQLQQTRQTILTAVGALKSRTALPTDVLQQKHIDAFTKLLRAKLFEHRPFAKEYLRLLVDDIRVSGSEIKLTGTYAGLAQAVGQNAGNRRPVPTFAPKWLPDLGSNQGPAD